MPDIVGRLRTPRLASAPATPVVGEMYYNTTNNTLYFWNGTAWTATSGAGGAMDLRYNGAWAPGSYTDGDIVIYNGVEYMAVRTTTQTPVPWTTGTVQGVPTPVVNGQWLKGVGGIPVWTALTQADVELTPYGTSLPASPFNGQEAILVDSTTNPTYQWKFRYNSGSTSAYKWEFVGGGQKYATGYLGAWQQFSGSSNWVAGSPSFAVPRAGDYTVSISAQFYSPTVNALIQFATGPASVGAINPVSTNALPSGQTSTMAHNGFSTVGAGGSITAWYWAANVSFVANSGMLILPVRVS